MHAAVATLQRAARQMQLSGNLERSEYGRIVTQLRDVADTLAGFERRTGKQKAAPVDFSAMLHRAAAPASPSAGECDATPLVPEGVMVEGPAHDLQDLLAGLVDYARTTGGDAVELRAQIKYTNGETRAVCVTELVVHSPNVPDFLRRMLWEAASSRHGEVSVVCEPQLCRIEFILPIERRLGIALG